jgi:hypothetical protein
LNPALLAALLVGLAIDVNVAGSIFVNNPTLLNNNAASLGPTNKGFNGEAAFKLVADVSPTVSASVKVCYGCHDFQADQAHMDWTPTDAFNVRLGRFPVPFGEFYLRHDPANHRSVSKPLPYEMGRMLRRDAYNLTVLPEPYPDNGIELYGTFRGDVAELAWSLYAVAGLKGNASTGDLDFIRSRTEYFADNNRTPSTGGRLSLSFVDLPGEGLWRLLSIGASGMGGYYDDDGDLSYLLAGVDLYTRIGQVNVRGELMMRRTAIPDNPAQYRQALVDLFTQREGFYLEVDAPATRWLEWLVRYDGFRISGPTRIGSALPDGESTISRGTAGINLIPTSAIKLKLNYEYWRFSAFDNEHLINTGIVGTF